MNKKRQSFDTSAKDDLESRLNDINRRHGRDVNGKQSDEIKKPDNAGMANGMRIASEFVSSIIVGAAIGYGIDWIFGVSPFAMILFMMLGFVAGILNVIRITKQM